MVSPTKNYRRQWSVFLPLKPFSVGKSRMIIHPTTDRAKLIKAMASDVIDAILNLSNIEMVTLVGVCYEEMSLRNDPRLRSYLPNGISDINGDIRQGIGTSQSIAVILPDLPALTSEEIAIAFTLAEGHQQSFIRDHEGTGSTMYFASSREYFSPQFGVNSAPAHVAGGVVELNHPNFYGIRRDCDEFDHLTNISPSKLGPATRSFVEQMMQRKLVSLTLPQ